MKRHWQERYGNLQQYRKTCAIAHRQVQGRCCWCFTRVSEELHHGYYGKDQPGVSVFPVCRHCHQTYCHSPENWIRDRTNPKWKNRNTPKALNRLQLGYKLLYKGVNPCF